jgi:hypothetical protein
MANLCEKCVWGIKTSSDGYNNVICKSRNNNFTQALGPYGGCSLFVKNDANGLSTLSLNDREYLRSLTTPCYSCNRENRDEEILKAGEKYQNDMSECTRYYSYPKGCFIDGAKWSDENPKHTKEEYFTKFIVEASKWIEENIPYDPDFDESELSGRDVVEYYDEKEEYISNIVGRFVEDMRTKFGL